MAVRDDWQGKGAGTALDLADNWPNLVRLELDAWDNEPAIRLWSRAGPPLSGTGTASSRTPT